jgi:hypothetical protein
VASSAVNIFELYILIILQEHVDTVTAERIGSVGEEDCIKIKTEEEFCMHLVRTVKCEEEVSVVFGLFCGSD